LINSLSADPKSYEKILPLAARYGACLIVLALDEKGIIAVPEVRFEAVEKVREVAKEYDIGDDRLVIDSLVTSSAVNANGPQVTLETLRLVKQAGLATVLGISNVSFGLPDRAALNRAFFNEAQEAGLDAAIVDPRQITGAEDDEHVSSDSVIQIGELSMQELSDKFKSGEIFLPQLMVAIDEYKAQWAAQTRTDDTTLPTIIFATVAGDIHSIGKDICVALLESQGFRVIDLGVDVAITRIVNAARKTKPVAVCLSTLMTTTLPNMKATIDALHAEMPDLPVCVGGAVVTDAWAAVAEAKYSCDAPSCVSLVESLKELK